VELNSIKLEFKKLTTDIAKKQKQHAELEQEISQLKKQLAHSDHPAIKREDGEKP
jgi:cell division protein FtsB